MVNKKKKKTKLGITSLLFSTTTTTTSSSSSSTSYYGGRDTSTTSGLPYSSSSCSNMSSSSSAAAASWQWPSCKQPRTLSFRQQQQQQQQQTMMKTMNSAYSADFSGCFSTNSFASRDSLSSTCRSRTASDASASADAVTRALRSDRLFFDPDASLAADDSSSAVLKLNKTKTKKKKVEAFSGATAMSIESSNPYRDFRASMEAMVTSGGGGGKLLDDWRWLEEMLGWYLRANVKSTHGLIVGAFVDLLVSAAASPSPSPASSSSSPAAKYSSCCSACSSSSIKEEQAHQLHPDINY